MLIKVYRAASEAEGRYSPAEVASVEVVPVYGQPDSERICTSIVERQNLSVRMGTRRFTRLTNAFSKKWENHWAAVACWFAFYNFCRVHKSIRMTPAMAAEISDHIGRVRELREAKNEKRVPIRHISAFCSAVISRTGYLASISRRSPLNFAVAVLCERVRRISRSCNMTR